MNNQDVLNFTIEITSENTTDDDLDHITRNLLAELNGTEVDSAELVTSGSAPAGSKSADPITIGAIAIAVLPTFLPKIVEVVQAWALRGNGRTVKFKGKIGGQAVEFEGHPEDLQKLLITLSKEKQKK